jgi:hypothetical protein
MEAPVVELFRSQRDYKSPLGDSATGAMPEVLETRFGFVILPGLGKDSGTKADVVPTARINIDSQFLLVFRAPLIKGTDSKLLSAAPIKAASVGFIASGESAIQLATKHHRL